MAGKNSGRVGKSECIANQRMSEGHKAPDMSKGVPQMDPKLPKGHFDSDGLSSGKQTGSVRPTHDASQ